MTAGRDINPLNDDGRVQVAHREVERIARMYTRKMRGDGDLFNELVQVGWAQLAADARTFNPARAEWPVFVRMVVRAAMRRALYVQRSPVSGSPWRASKWSAGLRGVEVDPEAHADDGTGPERAVIGRRFIDTLLRMLRETAAIVPNGMLGLRVILGENSGDVAREAGVSVATVMRAAAAFREAVNDSSALCAFVEEEVGHG